MTRFLQAVAVLVVALFAGGGLVGLHTAGSSDPGAGPHEAALASPRGADEALLASVDEAEATRSASPLFGEVVFEENLGQFPDDVRFVARIAGGLAAFTDSEIRLVGHEGREVVLDLLAEAVPEGREPAGRVNHIKGSDSAAWVVDALRFRQIVYPELHDGIDLHVYATPGGSVEFDHAVAPGADPGQAGFRVRGADPVVEGGELVLGEELRLKAPYAYQETVSGEEEVAVAFSVVGDLVRYGLGAYDATLALVIDPEVKYSSYIGQTETERGIDVTVRNVPGSHQVDVWVVGDGLPNGMAPPGFNGVVQPGSGGGDVIVARFQYDRLSGVMTPMWFTYLGGSGGELATAAVAGAAGEVHVTGGTTSLDFPMVNPVFRPAKGAGDLDYDGSDFTHVVDAYVTTLGANGTPTFSTYLGGAGFDEARDIALAPNGDLVVGGIADAGSPLTVVCVPLRPGHCIKYGSLQSSGAAPKPPRRTMGGAVPPFPTTNGAFQENSTGGEDAFLAQINTRTSPASFTFSTLMGGAGDDEAFAVHASANHIHLAGRTIRNSQATGGFASAVDPFPTTPGAYATEPDFVEPFVARFELGGNLLWSTLLDGSASDKLNDLDVDGNGHVWVTGMARSTDFPVCPASCISGAHPPVSGTSSGASDGFVVQIDGSGSALRYSSYLGGSSFEEPYSIDLDPEGRVVVSGRTFSSDFPVTSRAPSNNSAGGYDLFVTRIDPATGIDFSTYFGGSEHDYFYGQELDDSGMIYLAGTVPPGIPTKNAVQPVPGGPPVNPRVADWDMSLLIVGKLAPEAVIGLSSLGYPDARAPNATSYEVLTQEPVFFNDTFSVPGDKPIDPSLTTWTLLDGSTVLSTDVGSAVPSFDGMALAQPGVRTVCLEVTDTSPPGSYDRTDRACLDVEWRNRPPIPDFVVADTVPTGIRITFADASFDQDGSIVDRSWDFGEGSASSEKHPSHVFVSPGTFEVNLTIMDDHGVVNWTTRILMAIDGPVADFSYPADHLLIDEPIQFEDLSIAGENPIQTWTWDLGGSVIEHQAAPGSFPHTFTELGDHEVSLTVSDGELTHAVQKTITIVEAKPLPLPDAYRAILGKDLEASASKGLLSNDQHSIDWDLQVDSYTQPEHGAIQVEGTGAFTYTPPKDFFGQDTFMYRLKDGRTTVGPIEVEVLVVSGVPAEADFDLVVSGTTVVFQDQSVRGDLPIVEWHWTFSDGSEATTQNPYHVFVPGHHSATLRVTDTTGTTSTVTKQFRVFGPAGEGGLAVHARGIEREEPEQVEVGAVAENRPPTAAVSAPEQVLVDETVGLDASGSSDPDGDELSFHWRQVDGPPVEIIDPQRAEAGFTAPSRPGEVVFELEVFDGQAMDLTQLTVLVHRSDAPAFDVVVHEDGTHWFNATRDGTWSLGDGTTAQGDAVSHRFSEPGAYVVRYEADGVESVQTVHVDADGRPDLPGTGPVGEAEPAQTAAVPEPRILGALAATAAGMGLLLLLLWAYRTWSLVWIRVFTRVGRPEILDHPLRARIHNAVQERPGIVLTDLVGLVEKSRRTVLHHVRMLEGAGLVTVKKDGRFTAHYPTGTSNGGLSREAALRSELAQRLLQAANGQPGMNIIEATQQLGAAQSTVFYHVARLEQAGLLRKVKDGGHMRLFAAEGLPQEA